MSAPPPSSSPHRLQTQTCPARTSARTCSTLYASLLLVLACSLLSLQPAQAQPCANYSAGQEIGRVQLNLLDEASGLAASRQYANTLWTHNDSGDSARIFALSTNGEHLATLELENVRAVDYEDIALGPCSSTKPESYCIYLADFGNNSMSRQDLVIYRFPEPVLDATKAPQTLRVQEDIAIFAFVYPFPDLIPDAESLMVAPDATLYILTKETNKSRLLRFPADPDQESRSTLELLATNNDLPLLTAADMSPDGRRFAVRGYFYTSEFYLPPNSDLQQIYQGRGLRLGVKPEPQGEALAYSADGLQLLTTSEHANQPIYAYTCQRPQIADMGEDLDMRAPRDMAAQPELDLREMSRDADRDLASQEMGAGTPEPGANQTPSSCACASATLRSPTALALAFALLLLGAMRAAKR